MSTTVKPHDRLKYSGALLKVIPNRETLISSMLSILYHTPLSVSSLRILSACPTRVMNPRALWRVGLGSNEPVILLGVSA